MDFFALARGGERSYSTSFLINLDPDLLTLCAEESQTAFDLSLNGLVIQFHTYASITLEVWILKNTLFILTDWTYKQDFPNDSRKEQTKYQSILLWICGKFSFVLYFYLGLFKTIISLLLQYVQLNPNYRKFGKITL